MIKRPLQIEKTPKTRAFLFFQAKNGHLAKDTHSFIRSDKSRFAGLFFVEAVRFLERLIRMSVGPGVQKAVQP